MYANIYQEMQPQEVSCHSALVLCTLAALTKQGWQICGREEGKAPGKGRA